MTPAVLDALRDDLAFGEYFAFVHGGESLTAPAFWDVLDAVREARGAEPYDAHLLTNGLMLSVATAERLVAAGLRSVSVSLDGASAETNDGIRLGGAFEDVTRQVAEIVAWRFRENVDLRVGLSFVVLAQNVAELGAFVDLAASLGVDWVKFEEGVPATDFAKRSLVSCTAQETRLSIDAATKRGTEKGLVMVDHTFDRRSFRCRLDDEERAFLAADEFANRGAIHPCRAAWDTVFVEPNGDVRMTDFFGPMLGNVTESPLVALWSGPEAAACRERSRLERICGAGPVTCLT